MERDRKISCLVTLLIAVSACAPINEQQYGKASTEEGTSLAAQHFVAASSCYNGKSKAEGESFLIPLLLAIAPSLIDKGYSTVVQLLKTAGEDKVTPIDLGIGSTMAYRLKEQRDEVLLSSHFACVQGGVADLGLLPENSTASLGLLSDEAKAGLGLKSDPKFYFEGAVEISDDRTSFKINSTKLLYRSNFDRSLGSSSRDLFIGLEFYRPSADATAKPFATAAIRFEDIKPSETSFGEESLRLKQTGWLPLPGLDDEAQKRLTAVGNAQQSLRSSRDAIGNLQGTAWELRRARDQLHEVSTKSEGETVRALGRRVKELELQRERETAEDTIRRAQNAIKNIAGSSPLLLPINVKMNVIETREGNKVAAFLASVLDAAAPAAKELLTQQLPAQREALRAQQAREEQAAKDGYATAVEELGAAEADQKDLTPDATNRQRYDVERRIRAAKIRVNKAAIGLGRAEPFPEANY